MTQLRVNSVRVSQFKGKTSLAFDVSPMYVRQLDAFTRIVIFSHDNSSIFMMRIFWHDKEFCSMTDFNGGFFKSIVDGNVSNEDIYKIIDIASGSINKASISKLEVTGLYQ